MNILLHLMRKAMISVKDNYGRTIDYMRISVTDRCNLRCRYCMPEDIPSISHDEILRFEEILKICRCAVSLGVRKFKVTGGEPLVRKECLSFLRGLKALPGVEQVTLTTNGVLLASRIPELKAIGIDGINISLDTLDPDTFRQITGFDDFGKVWEGLMAAQASGIRTKVNSVLLQGINDKDFEKLTELAKDYPVDVRFIEIMPIGYGQNYRGYDRKALLSLLAARYPDYHTVTIPRGNGPASYIAIPGFRGCIGFIAAIPGKFCDSCNRIRLTSDGFLKPCLYYGESIDLKTPLRSGASDEQLCGLIREGILEKPACHQFWSPDTEADREQRQMSQIGG